MSGEPVRELLQRELLDVRPPAVGGAASEGSEHSQNVSQMFCECFGFLEHICAIFAEL